MAVNCEQEIKRLQRKLTAAKLEAHQWHEAFDRTMADYHTVTEQVTELRATADLLTRVRAGCSIDYVESHMGFSQYTIEGPTELMRELAEVLRRE